MPSWHASSPLLSLASSEPETCNYTHMTPSSPPDGSAPPLLSLIGTAVDANKSSCLETCALFIGPLMGKTWPGVGTLRPQGYLHCHRGQGSGLIRSQGCGLKRQGLGSARAGFPVAHSSLGLSSLQMALPGALRRLPWHSLASPVQKTRVNYKSRKNKDCGSFWKSLVPTANSLSLQL